MTATQQIPLPGTTATDPAEMVRRAAAFYQEMNRRRTVRAFSDRPVPRTVIEACVRTAGTAPSGAHNQPWHFVVVSNPEVKRQIREASEAVEQEFYHSRAPQEWLDALTPLETDAQKPFLETAPYLIAVFARRYGLTPTGEKQKHYYVTESVGIATGLLLTAIHHAGLAALTYTPNPMHFLNEILHRPSNERPFLLLVVGYPADDAQVPDLTREPLENIATFVE